ncbi:MAG: LysR family transcriptional regulator [Rhodobiaceae bacterium]|nr:LysR family transcriptional regulator [Rhodobiaceae bacterium]MCC0011864.1 LysR family transcriptional regulator [Rhodobiaceae bacterium]MCC0050479.1 LysR family transcriptional regulator [Rhodobiaceae bacterium]MCC0061218.1 LysR family transcriptional regulator [Rhodobiaceae bacterium]
MARDELSELKAFIAVADERSFTKAAAKLGISASALSHTIRGLEERLGLRLLARTTRSVGTTEAGERLYRSTAPHFEQIKTEIDALSELRDKPSGTVRISSGDHAADTILRPRLATFLPEYPDINVEVSINNGFIDIVGEKFDAGVRLGESISKDMIAVRIGPDWRFNVVGAPSYFARRSPPEHPSELTNHQCINLRLPAAGGLYAWEFEKDGRELDVRVGGQLAFDSIMPILNAAVDDLGLAFVPEDLAQPYIETGQLQVALSDWCPPFQGYHLYYPNRRLTSPAFARLVEALRFRV